MCPLGKRGYSLCMTYVAKMLSRQDFMLGRGLARSGLAAGAEARPGQACRAASSSGFSWSQITLFPNGAYA